MIIFPMAGLSSRFTKAGYTKPKYMLEAHGLSLFCHSVLSFKSHFNKEPFLFICLDILNTPDFIRAECERMGLKDYSIVVLDNPTRGQAETVFEGLEDACVHHDTPITIFNIDTFRPGFTFPDEFNIHEIDGYLETFVGTGKNWSNVLPKVEGGDQVSLTAEKKEISPFCCTGLYYWRKAGDFIRVFEGLRNTPLSDLDAGEFYIAPMYNQLIAEGSDVRFTVIDRDEVIFCGVPDEYEEFKSNPHHTA